ncbi:hypothetical protein EV356DRAFT_116871 [Viridothelium virens]|uniref:Uncharacterized protein n=1 Tax=Viridothelium virens TaxID=1048519 RepID=A0A6A6HCW1_VIRVR|nr:hypothetical protein EV356DRAFT_116871 [Viridothelium virens]
MCLLRPISIRSLASAKRSITQSFKSRTRYTRIYMQKSLESLSTLKTAGSAFAERKALINQKFHYKPPPQRDRLQVLPAPPTRSPVERNRAQEKRKLKDWLYKVRKDQRRTCFTHAHNGDLPSEDRNSRRMTSLFNDYYFLFQIPCWFEDFIISWEGRC